MESTLGGLEGDSFALSPRARSRWERVARRKRMGRGRRHLPGRGTRQARWASASHTVSFKPTSKSGAGLPTSGQGGDSASREHSAQELGRDTCGQMADTGMGSSCTGSGGPREQCVASTGELCAHLLGLHLLIHGRFHSDKGQRLTPGPASGFFCNTHTEPGAG